MRDERRKEKEQRRAEACLPPNFFPFPLSLLNSRPYGVRLLIRQAANLRRPTLPPRAGYGPRRFHLESNRPASAANSILHPQGSRRPDQHHTLLPRRPNSLLRVSSSPRGNGTRRKGPADPSTSSDVDGHVAVWDLKVFRPRLFWKAHEGGLLAVEEWDEGILSCVSPHAASPLPETFIPTNKSHLTVKAATTESTTLPSPRDRRPSRGRPRLRSRVQRTLRVSFLRGVWT